MSSITAPGLLADLRTRLPLVGDFRIRLGDCTVRIKSNTSDLLDVLGTYFALLREDGDDADITIEAFETEVQDWDVPWADWKREPGELLKERFADVPGGRLVQKSRTGMHMMMAGADQMVVGPCLKNDNQVVNFVVSRQISWLMNREWVLCHAAAVVHEGRDVFFLTDVGAHIGGPAA